MKSRGGADIDEENGEEVAQKVNGWGRKRRIKSSR